MKFQFKLLLHIIYLYSCILFSCQRKEVSLGVAALTILGEYAKVKTSIVNPIANALLQENPEINSYLYAKAYCKVLPLSLLQVIWYEVNWQRPIIIGSDLMSVNECIELLQSKAPCDSLIFLGGNEQSRNDFIRYIAKRSGRKVFQPMIRWLKNRDVQILRDNDEAMLKIYESQYNKSFLSTAKDAISSLRVKSKEEQDIRNTLTVTRRGSSLEKLKNLPSLLVYYETAPVMAWQEESVHYYIPRPCPQIMVIGGKSFQQVLPFLQKAGEILNKDFLDNLNKLCEPANERIRIRLMNNLLQQNGFFQGYAEVFNVAKEANIYTLRFFYELIDQACILAAKSKMQLLKGKHIKESFEAIRNFVGQSLPPEKVH